MHEILAARLDDQRRQLEETNELIEHVLDELDPEEPA